MSKKIKEYDLKWKPTKTTFLTIPISAGTTEIDCKFKNKRRKLVVEEKK